MLCILYSRTLSGQRGMKRKKSRRTGNDQLTSQVDGDVDGDSLAEIALQQASADYYEQRWRNRFKDHKGDFWIAIGLYLILSSVAFVVL